MPSCADGAGRPIQPVSLPEVRPLAGPAAPWAWHVFGAGSGHESPPAGMTRLQTAPT